MKDVWDIWSIGRITWFKIQGIDIMMRDYTAEDIQEVFLEKPD